MFSARPADDSSVWWLWVVGGLVAWFVLAFGLAVVIGRGIRTADLRTPDSTGLLTTEDLARQPAAARVRRRAVPLPPIGIALAALAVGLMTVGYGIRLSGATGPLAQALSMDDAFSLPRMYVAALFAAAALAAIAGAGTTRRTWWLAVGVVAAGIAVVKAGGTVHVDGMHALSSAFGQRGAVLISAVAAVVVVSALFFLSRTERRDRRRILGALAGYAVASVGLSALSSAAPGGLAATVTYLEESGEALAGVAFLLAVLVGVAPRLVLPAEWALRRALDAETLDVREALPGRPATGDAQQL